MFDTILLATDGSAASEHAAALALDLARVHHARVIAVYVVDPYPYLGIGDTNPMGLNAYLATAHEHAAQAHANVLSIAAEHGPEVPVEVRLVEDATVVAGLLAIARDEHADLIVAGSHGRHGVEALLLGSVAARLAARSPVPVLVAPRGRPA